MSDFDIGNPKRGISITKGHLYSFGQPHSVYKKVYNPDNPLSVHADELPGPGTYNDRTLTIGREGKKYGFQGRSKNVNGKLSL